MKRTVRFLGAGIVCTSIAFGALISGAACAPAPDSSRTTDIYTYSNSYAQFAGGAGLGAGVEGMLEAHCATLDCHGQLGRPLRLFSQNGLRLVDDAGNVSGGAATTSDEIFANFTAAISLQPELTSLVFSGNGSPTELLLVRKPRQMERHKGGQVIQVGDPSDNCLNSWLTGVFDPAQCTTAASIP